MLTIYPSPYTTSLLSERCCRAKRRFFQRSYPPAPSSKAPALKMTAQLAALSSSLRIPRAALSSDLICQSPPDPISHLFIPLTGRERNCHLGLWHSSPVRGIMRFQVRRSCDGFMYRVMVQGSCSHMSFVYSLHTGRCYAPAHVIWKYKCVCTLT